MAGRGALGIGMTSRARHLVYIEFDVPVQDCDLTKTFVDVTCHTTYLDIESNFE